MPATGWRRIVLGAGLVAGAVTAWWLWQRSRAAARAAAAAAAAGADEPDARAEGLAQTVGVASVDPGPLTQVAADGIDLDADPSPPPRLDDVVDPAVRDRASTLRS
ncbi:MAG TPA: hypothetical protein VHE35_19640 [Kofleriaceae bacterium]|nr:hypothetical protein [Kofleriaceae bacterium]